MKVSPQPPSSQRDQQLPGDALEQESYASFLGGLSLVRVETIAAIVAIAIGCIVGIAEAIQCVQFENLSPDSKILAFAVDVFATLSLSAVLLSFYWSAAYFQWKGYEYSVKYLPLLSTYKQEELAARLAKEAIDLYRADYEEICLTIEVIYSDQEKASDSAMKAALFFSGLALLQSVLFCWNVFMV